MNSSADAARPDREHLLHMLYEAAELEHNLMCTYLYAAFSLKEGEDEGLTAREAEAVARWRRAIVDVAIEEMGHLVAVWNVTAALGGAPRFGRMNFPLDPGYLPAGVVVKLAPFTPNTLQHFIHLERPVGSSEPDGEDYAPERLFVRGVSRPRLTPMGVDYETVGEFYAMLEAALRAFVAAVGEEGAFCGDPALQLSRAEVEMHGAAPVSGLTSALAALDAIIVEGEGAPGESKGSHFEKFKAIRTEYGQILAGAPGFAPAHPAATNPVLRRPPKPEGRVWIENETAARAVDLANAAYGLMLRLMAHAYAVPGGAEKGLTVDLALGLMRALSKLGGLAARLPAGLANPQCNAGVSFTTLRDAAALPPGPAAWRFFEERMTAFAKGAEALAQTGDGRAIDAARILADLAGRVGRGATLQAGSGGREGGGSRGGPGEGSGAKAEGGMRPAADAAGAAAANAAPSTVLDGVEIAEGQALTLMFEAKRCIHARFCVTGAPMVFLANVQGPWIHPDAIDPERLVDIAHACPSGAIRYARKDGRPQEAAPPVNLMAVREAGPYAVRGALEIDGAPAGTRATLCRCGQSKNKPFCDGSHHEAGFAATGEPPSGATDMLAQRDGPLRIDPVLDGPLQVRGNLEITSGAGRVVARVTSARLCRCGASATKPFCDGSHARVGFRS